MAKASKMVVPISRRALIARINRMIETRNEQLIISRGDHAKTAVGHYWIKDTARNCVLKRNIDLEDYARKLGVLEEFERYEGDS